MKKFLLLFIFINFIIYSFAKETIISNFIKIPPFARAVAMGEAFCAISDGTYGLYYNPAALSTILGYEVHISDIYWLQGINYWYAGLINPDPILDWGKIGLSFSYFKVNRPREISQNSIIAWEEFEKIPDYIGNYSVNFASAIDFSEEFSTGINLQWTYDFTEKVTGSNLSVGLGSILRTKLNENNLKFGLIFSSNGPKLRYIERGISIPDTLTFGSSYEFSVLSQKVLIAAQLQSETQYKSIFNAGFELVLYENFALRAGGKIGAFNTFSTGFGYKNKNIEINYAYEVYEKLGNCHYFSFILTWGTPSAGFSLAPDLFSPDGNKKFDIIYLMPKFHDTEFIKNAKIKIYDKKDKLCGEIPLKDYKIDKIIWDGKVNGKVLKDGEYKISAEAEYIINGSSESERAVVIIDTAPPEIYMEGKPKYLKPGQDEALLIPATFYFSVKDKSGISEWDFEIKDKNGEIFFNTKGEGEPPEEYLWNGIGNNGEYINTGEYYYYSLTVEDNAGNKIQSPSKYQLVLLKEIKLTFSSDAIFEPGSADVKIESFSKLKTIKDILNKYPESEIIIIGYSDDEEIKKYGSEEDLSLKRANAIKFYINEMLGIKNKKITIFGNRIKTNSANKINRKVEVIIKSTIYE